MAFVLNLNNYRHDSMKLVGNKNDFGVEYKVKSINPLMGYAKVWFGGDYLGTSEDYIYLEGYLLSGLRDISFSLEIDFPLSDKDEMFLKLYSRLQDSNDNNIHRYVRNFGTMTDDFAIFSFLHESTIHILWKLINDDTPFSDLNNLSIDEVNYFSIDKREYLNKLKVIEHKLLELKGQQ